MRSSVLIAAPLVAAAYAKPAPLNADTTTTGPVVITEVYPSGTTSVTSLYTYSNGQTSYLTETNSNGVITGMPTAVTRQSAQPAAVTTQPQVVTSQPAVATIPAGEPTGIDTIPIDMSSTLNSVIISVDSSTTVVIGGDAPTDASVVTGATPGVATGKHGGNGGKTATSGGPASGSSTAPSSSKTSSNAAADTFHVASAGFLGLGALFAAFL